MLIATRWLQMRKATQTLLWFFVYLSLILTVSCKKTHENEKTVTPPITLGAIFSLSGFGALGGTAELNGTLLAIDDINQSGGILGRPLRIIYEDNQSELKSTVKAFSKLADIDKIPAVLGPNWAEFSEVAAPIAEQKGTVMLTASGYTEKLTEGRRFVFTTLPSHQIATLPLMELISTRKEKNLFIATSASAYTEAIASGFIKNLNFLGFPEPEAQIFNPQVTDYRSTIARIIKDKREAVVVFLLEGGELHSFFKQLRDANYQGSVYSLDLTYDEAISKNPALAEGVVFFHYAMTAPDNFLRRYKERWKSTPTYASPKAYDNVFLVKQAIENCGLSSEQIRECLTKTDYQGISGRIRFDSNGNITGLDKVTKLMVVRGGIIREFEASPQ